MLTRISYIFTIIILFSCTYSIAEYSNQSNIHTSIIPDEYLINGVTYIPQSEGYYCYYADISMILNYLGFNTSIDELLFFDGLGYTHFYLPDERLPKESRYYDLDFIFSLFGLKENWWYPDYKQTSDEQWEQYYTNLKENISNGNPVITRVDPFSMPSLKNQFTIPNLLWYKIFPSGHHLILIIGYNENNQSICYNDPNAGFYGDDPYGDHAWINIKDFRNAIDKNTLSKYLISTIKIINEPYCEIERFEKSINLNLIKLQGNNTNFYYIHGIEASKMMKNHFSKIENNKQTTISKYKKYGDYGINFTFKEILYKLFLILTPDSPTIFDIFIVGEENPFYSIAREKEHVSDYLEKDIFYKDFSINQSILLKKESKLWNDLSNYYKIFMSRGIFLSNIRANILMEKMEKIVDEIIKIEQELIDSSMEFLSI